MMQGKIIYDGLRYIVKVGSVAIDVTSDIEALIAQENARMCAEQEEALARQAAAVKRHYQIVNLILEHHTPYPTA